MSEEPFPELDQETKQRLVAAVMQELDEGGQPAEIIRQLNASGWTKEAAEEFVEFVQVYRQHLKESPEVVTAEYLQARFPEMRPIRSAPTLFTINGIGLMMYGLRGRDPETNTRVETHVLSVLFLPVLALGAYRTALAGDGGRYVLGKVPLSGLAKTWNWLIVCALLAASAYGSWTAYTNSPEYRARAKLGRADRAAQAGQWVEASQLYGEVAAGSTRHAGAAREKLAGLIDSKSLDELSLGELVPVFRNAANTPGMGRFSQATFDRGLQFVRRHVQDVPQEAIELLSVIAPLASPTACETFASLVDQQLADLPAGATLAIFRTAVAMPRDAEQQRTIAECGFRQCMRLAPTDLAAAVELLQTVAPLAEPASVQDPWDRLLGDPLDRLACADVGPLLAIAKDIQVPQAAARTVARGCKWLDDHPDADPRQSLALIDQLAEYAPADGDALNAARRRALERIVVADPQDAQAAVRLAVVIEPEGDAARIEALLSPHRDQLGTGEGARLLGQLLADQGKWDESYALLGPYLDDRLDAYHQAEQQFQEALSNAQERVIYQLRQGTATDFAYANWETATEGQQKAMFFEYVNRKLNDDRGVAEASGRLSELGSVVPAALDLGMVMLYRAQQIPDPGARQAELERAEKTFLAVRGAAGDTDRYRLHLGQVYYWLGKHDEGHEQFEQLLAAHERSYALLMPVATVLRNLGAMAESRQLLEEAYEKAGSPEEKTAAAHLRGITETDVEDKISWLERADVDSPETKATLACARGERAANEGKDDEAAGHYREAVAIYRGGPQVAATFNNGALACLSLYQISGDREAFELGLQWVERAVALSPSDSLVLENAAHTLTRAALQDLAGAKLNLRELYQLDKISVLYHLAYDADALEAIRSQARQHAGLSRALSYLDQAVVLRPKSPSPYYLAMHIRSFLRDEAALERLAQRLRETSPDLQEMNEHYRRQCCYEDDGDEQTRVSHLGRVESLVQRYAPQPEDPAFAVSVARLVELNLDAADLQSVDADRLVQLAEQAHTAAPSRATYRPWIEALALRGHQALATAFPEYAEATRGTARTLTPTYLISLILNQDDPWSQAARSNQDVQQAIELRGQLCQAFPDTGEYAHWALLRVAHADQAQALADRLAEDPVSRLEREIGRRLFSVYATYACGDYWESVATGRSATARECFAASIQLGVPVPIALIERADGHP